MYRHYRKSAAVAVLGFSMAIPLAANAGAFGSSAVRDAAVANTIAGTTVPCPRLGQNVPANLAAQMDCGSATPRVAGERVRNTGGLFGGHRIGSAPPANSDDDKPFSVVRDDTAFEDGDDPTDGGDDPTDGGDGPTDGGDGPTDGGDGPTDGGDGPTDGGDGPTDGGGFTSKADRFGELGVDVENFPDQRDDFRESYESYLSENGRDGDWSGFNPTN